MDPGFPFLNTQKNGCRGIQGESALVGNEKRQFHSSNPSILT
jgi:hypothetical protein